MQLNLDKSAESTLIRSVRETEAVFEIHIGEQTYTSSLILSPDGVKLWSAPSLASLTAEDYLALAELDTEVILLGTGRSIQFPSQVLTKPLIENQKGLEIMDTAAACRTYNILLADGRSVSAALIIEA